MATTIARNRTVKAQAPGKFKLADMGVAVAALVIIGMMILPMPEWGLDVMLTLNIALSLTAVLVTVYMTEPVQFSSFPSMLLLTTLFRLGLNIAATRLILLNASAGGLISAFGNIVVGGNYVVGVIIFIILIIVQFMVISNGTNRIAEVAARFTLDAMPGKQMAIDADMNAGLIDEHEARRRRQAIAREADFYGAMDGASKFVRGDTIASIVMILVNIIGGFIVGIVQKNMDFMTALQTYTLLTVGEGLVTQIPGLLTSAAAGLIVTKTESNGNLSTDVSGQLFSQPAAIYITAAVCGILALIPGMPKLPLILVAGGTVFVGQQMKKMAAQTKKSEKQEKSEKEQAAKAQKAPEQMSDLLVVDPIEIELGYGVIPLADPKQGGDLLERITAVRRQSASELGMLIPAIRVRDNMQLKPNSYVIKLREVEIAKGEVYTGHLLAMNSGAATTELHGIETVEPAFGLAAVWISDLQQTEAEMAGYTVVDPLTVMITHLTEVLRRNAAEILTRQDTQTLIDTVKDRAPAVVNELVPELLSVGDVQKVLQNLLGERVSIRDLATILEALADGARVTRDPDALSEYCRQALSRQICAQYQSPDGAIRVFTLDPALEQTIADNVRHMDSGAALVLDPNMVKQILTSTKEQAERMVAMGNSPVALCSPRTRLHFRRLIERMSPTLAVLSFNELAAGVGLETVGMVDLTNENAQDQSRQYA